MKNASGLITPRRRLGSPIRYLLIALFLLGVVVVAFAAGIGIYAAAPVWSPLLLAWWPGLLSGAAIIVALGAWWLWWRLPKWQVERLRLAIRDPKARADVEDNIRKTVGQLLGGAAVLIGAGFAYLQFQQQQQAAHDLLISNQVSKGFEQLGSKETVVRLGGIYALEGVMNTDKQYYTPVLEALCAFVRDGTKSAARPGWARPAAGPTGWALRWTNNFWEHAQSIFTQQRGQQEAATATEPPPATDDDFKLPATDIQAALTVIGRRKVIVTGVVIPDLSGVHIQRANLNAANLSRTNLSAANLLGATLIDANLSEAGLIEANLIRADLSRAYLKEAYLKEAHLIEADLSRANLSRANLSRADLSRAHLLEANLSGAKLSGAYLYDANLSNANLRGANLRGAKLGDATLFKADLSSADLSGAGLLTQQQLDTACGDTNTKLDSGLTIKPCPP